MSQLSLILIPLSTLCALILPGVLKSDGWSAPVNGILSALIVAVFAAVSVWAGGQFTSDLAADWALFVAAYSALLAGPFKPFDQWIQAALHLPFHPPTPPTVRRPEPTPLVLPGGGK